MSINLPHKSHCESSIIRWKIFNCKMEKLTTSILSTKYSHYKSYKTIKFLFKTPKLFIFIFSWRIIALQYCVCFCHIPTWINHMYTYVPSLLNLPPTSQPIPPLEIVREHHICKHSLLIQLIPIGYLFHIFLHMFPCHSLHLSHPLFPLPCPQVCSLCRYLHSCPANRFISTIFPDSIYMY